MVQDRRAVILLFFLSTQYYGYTPNKPLGVREGTEQFKESRKGNPSSCDWIFENAMPNMDSAERAIATVRTLTMPSKHTIDSLDNNFKDLGHESYQKFLVNLGLIGDDINNRNKKNRDAGKPVYHYLHPSVLPASIDI